MKKKLSFQYLIQNSCGQIWMENNPDDNRLRNLKRNGCIIKSLGISKNIYLTKT